MKSKEEMYITVRGEELPILSEHISVKHNWLVPQIETSFIYIYITVLLSAHRCHDDNG